VWLVIHHRDSPTPSVQYHEAIEHALCFGWIDSQARKHDPDSFVLRFTPRRPRSNWSRVNRERAARMIGVGAHDRRRPRRHRAGQGHRDLFPGGQPPHSRSQPPHSRRKSRTMTILSAGV
jgi:hypothetical protein